MRIPFVIAEIGINHNGDVEIAKKLIDMAKECDCDAVKFQKRTVDTVFSPEYLAQPRESPWGKTVGEQKKGLEFEFDQYTEIDCYCREVVGIEWFASAWDVESQRFLKQFALSYNKIASPMIGNLDLLRMVASEGKHTFISTGLSLGTQIANAVAMFKQIGTPFTLMHCVNKYPCPDDECHLSEIPKLKEKYECAVGYSNHNTSILATSLAVALGAEAIEVHVTLDRSMYGSDQSASFEAEGLRRVVRDARRIKEMIR